MRQFSLNCSVGLFIAVWILTGVAAPAVAVAEDVNLTDLLKTFVEELVLITPGEGKFPAKFEMGTNDAEANERPKHEVTFQHPFSIARYETTQNLYQSVMGVNPSRWKGPRNSVEMMTWKDANEFCQKITVQLQSREQIGPKEAIRLPTEAEWEFCCRAATTTRYSFGDNAQRPEDVTPHATLLGEYAWHTGNAAGNDPPVGTRKPNPWGLYDMHGYLWEFTSDDWHTNYNPVPVIGKDPSQATEVKRDQIDQRSIVVRSGSWKDPFPKLTSTTRRRFPVTAADDAIGFRCVKDLVR